MFISVANIIPEHNNYRIKYRTNSSSKGFKQFLGIEERDKALGNINTGTVTFKHEDSFTEVKLERAVNDIEPKLKDIDELGELEIQEFGLFKTDRITIDSTSYEKTESIKDKIRDIKQGFHRFKSEASDALSSFDNFTELENKIISDSGNKIKPKDTSYDLIVCGKVDKYSKSFCRHLIRPYDRIQHGFYLL